MSLNNEPRYKVRETWIFNLESMSDKLFCIKEDVENGDITLPKTIASKTIESIEDLDNLTEECANLKDEARSIFGVSSTKYERIREIVEWRIGERYKKCIESGMSEEDARACYLDL